MVTSRSSRRTRITSESSSSGGGDSSGSSDSDEQHSNNGSAHEQEEVVRARGQHHVINGPFFCLSPLSLQLTRQENMHREENPSVCNK